ncbi:MAG: hypothetical protein COB12_05135 [Flavobacterium sp.]|nr:MAG: hypothetical protein COB12_05135 [Flavobacterium sp.]
MSKNEKVKSIGDNMLTIVFGVLLILVCIFQFYTSTKEKSNMSDYKLLDQDTERIVVQKTPLLVKKK